MTTQQDKELSSDLHAVVIAHCEDLERSVPILREYRLSPVADEFLKASAELRSALATSPQLPGADWRKHRMANVPHGDGMRLIGFVVPDDDAPLCFIPERIEKIIGAAPTASFPVAEQPAEQAASGAEQQMKYLGDANGYRWYWADQRFEKPGVWYWDGAKNVHVSAPHSPVAQTNSYTADDIAKAWYATGQDIRGGSLISFMDALHASQPTAPVAQMSGDVAQIIAELREEAHERRVADDTAGIFADEETAAQLEDWADRLAASHPSNAAGQDAPIAWVHEEDPNRVISAGQKEQALRDGGASASSVKPYSIAAVVPATTVPQVVQAPIIEEATALYNATGALHDQWLNGTGIPSATWQALHAIRNRLMQALLAAPQPVAASPSIVPTWEQRMEPTVSPSWTQIIRAMKAENTELRALLTAASNAGEAAPAAIDVRDADDTPYPFLPSGFLIDKVGDSYVARHPATASESQPYPTRQAATACAWADYALQLDRALQSPPQTGKEAQ